MNKDLPFLIFPEEAFLDYNVADTETTLENARAAAKYMQGASILDGSGRARGRVFIYQLVEVVEP